MIQRAIRFIFDTVQRKRKKAIAKGTQIPSIHCTCSYVEVSCVGQGSGFDSVALQRGAQGSLVEGQERRRADPRRHQRRGDFGWVAGAHLFVAGGYFFFAGRLFDDTCQTEALAFLTYGSKQRETATTAMNEHSSRSHAIYTVTLHQSYVSTHARAVYVTCVESLDLRREKSPPPSSPSSTLLIFPGPSGYASETLLELF